MKSTFRQLTTSVLVIAFMMPLVSWTGGPAPESSKDSLAIVRVVEPVNQLFEVKPVMYVSKGAGRIEQVQVADTESYDGKLMLKQTLTEFLTNGYTIQTATETVDGGLKLNTYYLKKKVI